nr:DUF6157 family protein [Neobacillus muris]
MSDDSNVTSARIPLAKNGKPTIASIEYELIKHHPYPYTQEEVQFKTYLIKNQIDSENTGELWEPYFSKPKACFRASPLVKNSGWGIHYNEHGKIAIYEVNSDTYEQLLHQENTAKLKGMRSKRKK